jgi:geranylgeranyl pyrophosphate synthase
MDFLAWATPLRVELDTYLEERFLDAWPSSFAEPLRYTLLGGGKRFRPLMVFAAYEALAQDPAQRSEVLPIAAAIEMVHTYSLVHDDLPAMDNDEERRGRPTLHRRWDEATAILAGDALLTESFSLLAQAPLDASTRLDLISLLSSSSGYRGMVGGQVADIQWPHSDGGLEELHRLHAMKTGALITFSAEAGALAAGASQEKVAVLRSIGQAVGLAFQLTDDVLDEQEDGEAEGTPSFLTYQDKEATMTQAHREIEKAQAQAATLPRPDALIALAQFCVNRGN